MLAAITEAPEMRENLRTARRRPEKAETGLNRQEWLVPRRWPGKQRTGQKGIE